MGALGEDIIGASKLPPFFKVANAHAIAAPDNRKGDALRTYVRSLSGFQKEALVRSAKTGDTWRLVSDEGPYLNGHDAACCPLAFLSVGMAASFMNEILAHAEQQNVDIRSLKLTLDNYYTMKGSMPRRTMVGGAENIELQVAIDCDLDDSELNTFLTEATYASELDGALLKDPADLFSDIEALPADVPALLQTVGPTPKKAVEGGTATGSSSLSDEQDRRLNIGAVATLRDDGIKEIQQMQYSPYGTSFRLLSSEDGRAPDANTLISAGIGFCFMTQFGRFVSMLKLDLPDYRIVQDTHFSLGGASGGTGKPGEADPIETHVYLQTSESDETAQEMLDISEQTCFLHAFCRTDLKTKLKVTRV